MCLLKRILYLLLFLFCIKAYATHNRAGEITYEHISNLTYKITIVTYTYTPSPADRPELTVKWGDGTEEKVKRINKINLENNISYNEYSATHTYPGAAEYKISFEDPNRNGGVVNIPNSVNVPFYVETILIINPFLGVNNSAKLLNPPIDNACVGKKFIHNPGVFDEDGDSIAYKLVECRGEGGNFISGYSYPIAFKSFSINAYTGDLVWDAPTAQGEYNIAIEIEEWRHGIKIGSIIRDMQILVQSCKNNPPEIISEDELCVVAGTIINLPIIAIDKDSDLVTLYGTGGPLFLTNSGASFSTSQGKGKTESMFKWETNCSHIQKQPYSLIFKAIDNSSPVNLSDIKNVKIKIVAPPPKFKDIWTLGNGVHLEWNDYTCNNAIGFKIYRREGYTRLTIDSCITGVPDGLGFQLIGTLDNLTENTFFDNNSDGLKQGINYCYVMIAYFPDGSESLMSDLICIALKRDVPIITNVSVEKTDQQTGQIKLGWSKAKELDTSVFKEPYKYYIKRSLTNEQNYLMIDSLFDINDTTYVDNFSLNTMDNSYTYVIEFYSNNTYIGSSSKASSVFLTTSPTDNIINLSYSFNVPWKNYRYVIYRLNDNNIWDSIATTENQSYQDGNLDNGKEYCYYVKTIGDYSIDNIQTPLINNSQIKCDVPIDNVAPCSPKVEITTECTDYQNKVVWNNPNKTCSDDVVKYKIYYSIYKNGNYEVLSEIFNAEDTIFYHKNTTTISGCYYVTAVDSFGNESSNYENECVNIDACPEYLYKLPNIFTPNFDYKNDIFTPFMPYGGVESIKMTIFNRWGKIVFQTENPNINWDGKNMTNKRDCTEGVYYYICDVYEYTIEKIEKRTIKGFIHLIRN